MHVQYKVTYDYRVIFMLHSRSCKTCRAECYRGSHATKDPVSLFEEGVYDDHHHVAIHASNVVTCIMQGPLCLSSV
jgi:hypothetical protein